MSISSANTEDLGAFVDASARAVDRLGEDLRTVRNLANAVRDASSFRYTETVSLDSVADLRSGWNTNGAWVATVRDELIESDRYDVNGNPIVSDRDVEQALERAGLERPPGAVTCPVIEVFGEPDSSGFADDPICLANGNFVLPETDLPMYGLAQTIGVTRTYNSRDDRTGLFGHRWSSVLDVSLDITEHRVTHRGPDGGGAIHHRTADGDWSEDVRRRRVLREMTDGWEIVEDHVRSWSFDDTGRITGFSDGPARVRIERSDGAITVTEELSGRSVRHDLDPDSGLVTGATASDGRTVTYRHRADDLVAVERDLGDLTYEIDDDGFLAACTDADGVLVFRNTYDPDGWVQSQIEQHGRETRYEYRPDGVSTVTSADGRPPNVMVHDRRGRMTAMIDGLGNAMRMTWDDSDSLTQIVDRTGAVTRFRRDGRGNVLERIDPDGLGVQLEWDGLDRVVSQTDRAGNTVRHEYDGDAREPVRSVLPDGSPVTSRIDEHGLLTAFTDADGVTSSIERDDHGDVTEVRIEGDDVLVRLRHDPAGRIVEAESDGNVARAEVDPAGRPIRLELPDGEERLEYSPAGRCTGGVTSEGARWRAEHDHTGEVVEITDEIGLLHRYERDSVGRIVGIVDAENGRTDYELDPVGRLVAVVDANRRRTEYHHDGEGRTTAIVAADGGRLVRERDVLGRIVAEIDPGGARQEFTYHPNGEIATETDAEGHTWHGDVDAFGRTVRLTDPTGATTSLRHTPAGRFLELRSPTGRVVHNHLDEVGRTTGVTIPDGTTVHASDDTGPSGIDTGADGTPGIPELPELPETTALHDVADRLEFDPRGHLRRAVDPAGIVTDFHRDACGRLLGTTTDSVGLSYELDPMGDLVALVDPHGNRTELRRGPRGEVVRIEHPDAGAIELEWDAVGRVRSLVDPDGPDRISFEHDGRGAITRVEDPHGVISAERDGRGDLLALTTRLGTVRYGWNPDGALTRIADDRHTVDVERDAAASITGFRLDDHEPVPTPAPIVVERDDEGRILVDEEGRRHTYDAAGRLASTTVAGRTTTYGYDDRGLLASETTPDGVRTLRHGPAGEILTIAEADGTETRHLHDLRGRRIGEQRDDGSQRDLVWDAFDRLTGIVDTTADGERREFRIERDPLGRPLLVDDVPILWADAHGLELHGVGEQRFAHHRGRVRVLTDPDGAWSRRVGDDPWGTTDDGDGVRIGHRGHLVVGDLVLMGARVYDPASRSFLSRDPLPSLPGQVSFAGLYQYAWCDPVNFLDPTGRKPLSDEDYAYWQEHNTKGWVKRNWKTIAVTAGAVAVGTVITIATGGAGGVAAAVLIGAAVGAGSGAVDAAWNGGTGSDIAKGALWGGLLGGATAGLGAGMSNAARHGVRGAFSASARQGAGRQLTSRQEVALRVATEYGGSAIDEGVGLARARMAGDRYARYDVGMFLIGGTMSYGGATVADSALRGRTVQTVETEQVGTRTAHETGTEALGPDAGSAAESTRTGPDLTATTEADGATSAADATASSPKRTLAQLRGVDGIGETLSKRVLAVRNSRGGDPLSMEQLLDIDGIGPVKAQAIMDAGMN